jgi:hypothetical protein
VLLWERMYSVGLASLGCKPFSVNRPRNNSYLSQTRYVFTTSVSQYAATSAMRPSRTYFSTSAPPGQLHHAACHDRQRSQSAGGLRATADNPCGVLRPATGLERPLLLLGQTGRAPTPALVGASRSQMLVKDRARGSARPSTQLNLDGQPARFDLRGNAGSPPDGPTVQALRRVSIRRGIAHGRSRLSISHIPICSADRCAGLGTGVAGCRCDFSIRPSGRCEPAITNKSSRGERQ